MDGALERRGDLVAAEGSERDGVVTGEVVRVQQRLGAEQEVVHADSVGEVASDDFGALLQAGPHTR